MLAPRAFSFLTNTLWGKERKTPQGQRKADMRSSLSAGLPWLEFPGGPQRDEGSVTAVQELFPNGGETKPGKHAAGQGQLCTQAAGFSCQ